MDDMCSPYELIDKQVVQLYGYNIIIRWLRIVYGESGLLDGTKMNTQNMQK